MEKHGHFLRSVLPYRFRVNKNPSYLQCLGMYKFPWNGNVMWKAISFPGCRFLRKFGNIFSQFMENRWEYIYLFHSLIWRDFSCEFIQFLKHKEKENSHSKGKIWESTNIPKLWVPKYFTWSRNPYNSQTKGWVNSHVTKEVRENTDNSQFLLYLTDLELLGTHQSPMSGNVQVSMTWKYSVENHVIPRLLVFEEIGSY